MIHRVYVSVSVCLSMAGWLTVCLAVCVPRKSSSLTLTHVTSNILNVNYEICSSLILIIDLFMQIRKQLNNLIHFVFQNFKQKKKKRKTNRNQTHKWRCKEKKASVAQMVWKHRKKNENTQRFNMKMFNFRLFPHVFRNCLFLFTNGLIGSDRESRTENINKTVWILMLWMMLSHMVPHFFDF